MENIKAKLGHKGIIWQTVNFGLNLNAEIMAQHLWLKICVPQLRDGLILHRFESGAGVTPANVRERALLIREPPQRVSPENP